MDSTNSFLFHWHFYFSVIFPSLVASSMLLSFLHRQILLDVPQEAQRIVVRAFEYSNSYALLTKTCMAYQDPFFLQIRYLLESACKSDFPVYVSYDSHFVFFLRPCNPSIQCSVSKKASFQEIMIIKMPFVLICALVEHCCI